MTVARLGVISDIELGVQAGLRRRVRSQAPVPARGQISGCQYYKSAQLTDARDRDSLLCATKPFHVMSLDR